MGFEKHVELIERIDQYIRMKNTGTPEELAQKLEISLRWLYECIAEMQGLNGPITYDKFRQSYIYEREGGFDFHFREK